jgi:outer membrane protein OmpA-like peptidoglycan-associated protein
MDGLIADKKAWASLAGAPEAAIQQSRHYYVLATQAYDDGDEAGTRHYAMMAKIAFDTADEQARAHRAGMRIDEAQQRIAQADSARVEHDERHAKFSKRVARMEKILALEGKLESEQVKSKKEKKKLAAQLEKVKEEQAQAEAAQEVEKKTRAVRNAMASVSAKIKTAEALDAEKSDGASMRGARDSLAQAERALVNQQFELATKLVATADAAAAKAIATARAQFAEQSKELNILAERKSLLEAATDLSTAKQEERGVVVTLLDMFAPQKAQIMEERHQVLNGLVELAKKYATYPVIVEGYTDSRGRQTDNLALSTSRAQAVVDYFVQKGKLAPARLKSAGYGESNPVADNSTADGRSKNRRIEVVFLFR